MTAMASFGTVRLLTRAEVAAILHVHPKQVTRLSIPSVVIGKRARRWRRIDSRTLDRGADQVREIFRFLAFFSLFVAVVVVLGTMLGEWINHRDRPVCTELYLHARTASDTLLVDTSRPGGIFGQTCLVLSGGRSR